MSAIALSMGRHARVPAQLIEEVTKPRAIQILTHLLTVCNPQRPEVWVDQGLLGSKLGIHRDTVGKWIRHLENIGRLVFIGFRADGRRKRYQIILQQELPAEEPLKLTSDEIAGGPPIIPSDDVMRNDRNINRIKETDIKEQTDAVVKQKYSSNQKIALKQKLKEIGVHKQVIDKLVSKYTTEKISAQIEHLDLILARGERIVKPASWLIAAIKGNYELPREIDKKTLEEEQKAKHRENAVQLAQHAQRELNVGNIEQAKELARRSLAINENSEAKRLLDEEQQKIERQKKIEDTRRTISPEKLENIRREEEQKKLLEMRKISGLSDIKILSSHFFKVLVDELINERLYAY